MNTRKSSPPKNDLPEYIDRSLFLEWMLHFKELMGYTMTEVTFRMQLRNLKTAHENGWDVNQMIKTAIAHGWKSFYFEGTHGKPKVNG